MYEKIASAKHLFHSTRYKINKKGQKFSNIISLNEVYSTPT
jgi:hypothetical protein